MQVKAEARLLPAERRMELALGARLLLRLLPAKRISTGVTLQVEAEAKLLSRRQPLLPAKRPLLPAKRRQVEAEAMLMLRSHTERLQAEASALLLLRQGP